MINEERMMSSKEISTEVSSILNELLRCEFGIPYLDDALLGMAPGSLTLVGARTGGGKTEFATQVLLSQQSEDGSRMRSTLYFALDHDKGEIERRVLWRLLVQQIYKIKEHPLYGRPLRYTEWEAGKYRGLTEDIESDAKTYLDHAFSMSETYFAYEKNEYTAEDIARAITPGGTLQDYNLFVIDHFHAIKGMDTVEKQTRGIALIAKAAEEARRPVLILGQFRKRSPTNKSPLPDMEEFSGSSQLLYLPQNIIVLAPRQSSATNKYETYFHVAKSRTASDSKMFVGMHSFDMETKKYSDKYEVMKYVPYSEPEILSGAQVPHWAKNAKTSIQNVKIELPGRRKTIPFPYKED